MRMRGVLAALSCVVAVVCASSGSALASIPDASGLLSGCSNVDRVRLYDTAFAGSGCMPGELPVSWSQTGPPGPAGLAGPAGPAGPPGPAGQGILGEARQWVDVKMTLPSATEKGDSPSLVFPLPAGNWSVTAMTAYRSLDFEEHTLHGCELREASAPENMSTPGRRLYFLPVSQGLYFADYVTVAGLFQSTGDGVVIDCTPAHLLSGRAQLQVVSLVAVRVGEIQRTLPAAPAPASPLPPTYASPAVNLSSGQRSRLRNTFYSPSAGAGTRRRAETVLLADQGKPVDEIAQATFSTLAQVRAALRAFK